MNIYTSVISVLFHFIRAWRWPILFGAVIVMAVVVRFPYLPNGHIDEVHTIGRALKFIYTGDLNPHMFQHPTGTMYISFGVNILALASMSRDVGGRPGVSGAPPLNLIQKEYPNPVTVSAFDGPGSKWWDLFRYRVRLVFLMFVPMQICLLWYIGKRLDLLSPALAAGIFLALCPANIQDSVYVSVNNTTAFFCLLTAAFAAYFTCRPPADRIWQWLFRMGVMSLICGLAVACKYNAGTFLLIPMVFGVMTLRYLQNGKQFIPEKCAAAFIVILLSMSVGFTILCPYWYVELNRFIQEVLFQVWYFKVGHKDYNTFIPGLDLSNISQSMLFINLRCLADQYSWTAILLTVVSIVYLAWMGFFKDPRYEKILRVLIPVFVASVGFFILMTYQAVFFARNFTIMWGCWFLCCAASWWFAAKTFLERRKVENLTFYANLILFAITAICLFKALWLDVWLEPNREWWRVLD